MCVKQHHQATWSSSMTKQHDQATWTLNGCTRHVIILFMHCFLIWAMAHGPMEWPWSSLNRNCWKFALLDAPNVPHESDSTWEFLVVRAFIIHNVACISLWDHHHHIQNDQYIYIYTHEYIYVYMYTRNSGPSKASRNFKMLLGFQMLVILLIYTELWLFRKTIFCFNTCFWKCWAVEV